MKGWVYVITNPSMPGILKVGYSTKDPKLRAFELNNTGAPLPYNVEYEVLVEDPYRLEQIVHSRLSDKREGKEWFRVSSDEAISVIRSTAGTQSLNETFYGNEKERSIRLERQIEEEASKEQRRLEREISEKRIRDISSEIQTHVHRVKDELRGLVHDIATEVFYDSGYAAPGVFELIKGTLALTVLFPLAFISPRKFEELTEPDAAKKAAAAKSRFLNAAETWDPINNELNIFCSNEINSLLNGDSVFDGKNWSEDFLDRLGKMKSRVTVAVKASALKQRDV